MDIKKQAKALTKEMRKTDPSFKLYMAYEALAKAAGYNNWNVYSKKLKQQREATERYRERNKK